MQRVIVRDLIGQNAVTLDDGKKIYDLIHTSLVHGNKVELDFNGVEIFASPFFNAGVGRLLDDLQPETLNSHLRFEHLSEIGSRVLRRVIVNAKEYYASSVADRKNVDQALTANFPAY